MYGNRRTHTNTKGKRHKGTTEAVPVKAKKAGDSEGKVGAPRTHRREVEVETVSLVVSVAAHCVRIDDVRRYPEKGETRPRPELSV